MAEFHSLEATDLERFLERHKASFSLRSEIDLDLVLREILRKANEFVPSQSGSILLDDPLRKTGARADNDLVFIATFGQGSEGLIGRTLSAKSGIAGRVYQTGEPYVSADAQSDANFYGAIDAEIGFKSNSIVCVPIYIGKNVCGVLELINRLDGQPFTVRDMTLLEIFAGYTSFTLQNALDARRAHELARRDDLTGLYNDRWLHVRLREAIADAEQYRQPCVLIFIDLDYFKTVNDRYGHLAGSQVLREVGFILKRVVDRDGAIVARYGGDEFVVILPNSGAESGVQMATQIKRAIDEAVFLQHDYGFGLPAVHLQGALSASIGVAEYVPGDESESPESRRSTLIRRADAAMYHAKSLGKGRIIITRDGRTFEDASEPNQDLKENQAT